jgi:hypothetical protein
LFEERAWSFNSLYSWKSVPSTRQGGKRQDLAFIFETTKGRVYGRTAMYITAPNLRLIDVIPRKPMTQLFVPELFPNRPASKMTLQNLADSAYQSLVEATIGVL